MPKYSGKEGADMTDNKNDFEGRFPGVEPIPEPDRPDHAATDMLDEVVTGILENKDEDEIKKDYKNKQKTRSVPGINP